MILWLYYKTRDGEEKYFHNCLSFNFFKEAYTPCTTLTAVAWGNDIPDDITEVWLYIEGYKVHHGFVDGYKVIKEYGSKRCIISSRGFTALLTENQLPPGMYTNMTFDRLFDEYFTLPNIEHESNTQNSYIYVSKGTSMWDGAANLAYKLVQKYPYIRGANKVMMSLPDDAREIYSPVDYAYSYGSELNTRRMVSRYNMADMGGEYGTFSADSQEALARGLIRNRHFDLDQRFLSDPEMACDFRVMMSERGYRRHFFTFEGYYGEDLNDIAELTELGNRRINAVRIKGGKKGIFTEISVYDELA